MVGLPARRINTLRRNRKCQPVTQMCEHVRKERHRMHTNHVINKLTHRLVINQDPAVITWTMLFFCNGLEIKNAPRQQEQWFRRISSLYRSIVKIYTIIKNGKVEIKKWTSWLCFCFLFSQCSCCTLVLPFTVCQCFHCSIVAAAHSIGLGFDGGLFNHHSGS